MKNDKKIYIIGIGGIGVSALARYYNENGFKVFGSDKSDSELIGKLKKEGINIIIGERPEFIDNSFSKVIYSESIPNTQSELKKAKDLKIDVLSYPEGVAEIGNDKKMIAIAGTHGKSTTTSLISLIFKNSKKDFSSIIGTLLFEFEGKNYFHRNDNGQEDYLILEACEYKRSFLKYTPFITVIVNIDCDHLDYYKDEDDYISAFKDLIQNTKTGGYVILNGQEENSKSLIGLRKDLNYIILNDSSYLINNEEKKFPQIEMNLPGEHILFDAKLAYIVGTLVGIDENIIIKTLESYNGAWRRMEVIGTTKNGNTIISDYGHHPTEIKTTLEAIKKKFGGKHMLTIFQPHQYSRTLKLLEYFVDSFSPTDKLIIPNIYESRDSEEDKKKIDTKTFVQKINHHNKLNGNGLENTLRLINQFDIKNTDSIIVLMGAGDVDTLRYSIHYE